MIAPSAPPKGGPHVVPTRGLDYDEAAIFECFVVPRYLSLFGERVVKMLAESRDARVCHVHCRTGYPERAIVERLPNAHVHGCDVSPYAIELARTKGVALAANSGGTAFDYRVVDGLPLPYPPGAFSHALTIHPLATPEQRPRLFEELARILAPSGQALVALPLHGSFLEIADLLRECALKHEHVPLSNAIETAVQVRPTGEVVVRELEAAGFEYVESDECARTLGFSSGRGFFEDPISRLLLVPEFRVGLGSAAEPKGVLDPFAYVRDAIDKYWSGRSFELTVNVGVVSGRRRA